jgi:hypothetical protein
MDTPNIHIDDHSLLYAGTGTSRKLAGLNQFNGPGISSLRKMMVS